MLALREADGVDQSQRIADVRIQPAMKGNDFAIALERALELASNDNGLVGILAGLNHDAYALALKHEVANAGGNGADVALVNADVVDELATDAQTSADSIVKTFERDLWRFIKVAQENGAAESELPQLIAQWNVERSSWKDAQIAITESARAAGQAQKDFIKRSKATGKAWFGNSLQCPICQKIAADNPYALDDTMVGAIMHPHELDYWRIQYDEVKTPWTGT